MPAPSTIDEFLDLTRKSGVVEDARLDAYLQEQRAAGTLPDAPLALANALIRDGLLTRFQAELLLSGKSRGFQLSGKYNLLERLGSGGMGSVFLCEHIIMRRRVAIKVLPAATANDPSSVERFHREARAVATLDHPNIVRAHDVDHDGKRHFLIMEYVDGASFHDIVRRRGPLEVARAANYIRQAAVGLEHAHEAGLVHRDIKPGNLLVDRRGTVKILDMGLAFFFHDNADNLTKEHDSAAVLGTADYLAPEQAMDSRVDIRADIYSLGLTFYFLLAGKSPFQEGSVAQKLIWHQARQPKPIRELRSDVPEGLAAVLDKMIAKDPAQRYQTPAEVVEALAPWTTTPIGPPPPEEMPKLSPAARGTGGGKDTRASASSPSLTGLGGFSTIKDFGPETRGPRPQSPMTMAGTASPPLPTPNPKAPASGSKLSTQVLADKKPSNGGPKTPAGKETRAAAAPRKGKGKPAPESAGKSGQAWAIAVMAVVLIGAAAAAVVWWKSNPSPPARPPDTVAVLPGNSPGEHGSSKAVPKGGPAKPPSEKPLGPEGAVGEIRRFQGHTGKGVDRVAFSPNGRQIASAGFDKTVRLWDAATGGQVQVFNGHTDTVHFVAFTPDSRRLISAGDLTVRLWDLETGKELHVYKGHTDKVWCAVPTPDGKRIVSSGQDRTIRLWDMATGDTIRVFEGHTGQINKIAVSPDGRQVLSASKDNTVRLWDIDTGHEIRRFKENGADVAVFSPDGRQALSGGNDKILHLWDLSTGKEIRTFGGLGGAVYIAALSPDGRQAVAGGNDKIVHLWDVASGKEVYRFTGHNSSVTGAAFAPHGRYVVSCALDNSIILWAYPPVAVATR